MSPREALRLRILTPEGLLLEAAQLREVIAPLADGGTIGIRPKHAPLIAETVDGPVRYLHADSSEEIALLAGVLQVRENLVSILTAGVLEADSFEEEQDLGLVFTRLIETLTGSMENEQDMEGGV